MPKTKAKTTSTMSDENVVVAQHQQQHQHIERLRDAVAVLAEQEAEARRQADDYARQQLSPVVVRSAQARAVELQQRLTDANTALFEAETGIVHRNRPRPQEEDEDTTPASVTSVTGEPERHTADSSVAGQRAAAADDAASRARAMVQQARDEHAAALARKDEAARRRPLVVQRIERLRDARAVVADTLAHAERDATLMTRARLPEPLVNAQKARAHASQTHLAETDAALAEAERELAVLDEAEQVVMPDLGELERDAQRMAELSDDYERALAARRATRAEKVAAARRACAAYVLALGDIGVYNWHAGLLASHKGIPPTLQTYRGLVGPAPDRLVEPIDYNEVVLAPAYWPALTLLPELPRELAGDVQSWAQCQGRASEIQPEGENHGRFT